MSLLAVFNLLEAAWWLAMASYVWLSRRRIRGLSIPAARLLALSLFAFGVSDLIETQTGAWWRPVGLLALKTACIAGIGTALAMVILRRARDVQARTPRAPPGQEPFASGDSRE